VTDALKDALPRPKEMSEAIVRLVVEYPREWDTLIDESALRKYTEGTFEFHLVKRPQSKVRINNREGQVLTSLSPLDLLGQYFKAAKTRDTDELQKLAQEIISSDGNEDDLS
jgi:exonuclease SbcD